MGKNWSGESGGRTEENNYVPFGRNIFILLTFTIIINRESSLTLFAHLYIVSNKSLVTAGSISARIPKYANKEPAHQGLLLSWSPLFAAAG